VSPASLAAASSSARGFEVQEASEATDTDGMQVRLDHGFISQEEAQEAVMARWPELRRCYREAGPASAFAGGQVSLRFVVDPTGATSAVQVVESRLGNFEVERCLVGVGRSIRFPRPQGAAVASVDYTLEFHASGETAVVDVPDGAVDTTTLGEQLASQCEALSGGEVVATVYVDRRGAVRSAGLASSAPLEDSAGACLTQALRRSRIPAGQARNGAVARLRIALPADVVARRDTAEHPRPDDQR
jgi:hypothetical protein